VRLFLESADLKRVLMVNAILQSRLGGRIRLLSLSLGSSKCFNGAASQWMRKDLPYALPRDGFREDYREFEAGAPAA